MVKAVFALVVLGFTALSAFAQDDTDQQYRAGYDAGYYGRALPSFAATSYQRGVNEGNGEQEKLQQQLLDQQESMDEREQKEDMKAMGLTPQPYQ